MKIFITLVVFFLWLAGFIMLLTQGIEVAPLICVLWGFPSGYAAATAIIDIYDSLN